jgi:Fe-S-cluster containining protein
MTKDCRHELIENFNQYRIGLDDIFAFKCRSCGKCCRNREDILLNSRDVYNIASALNLTHEQVIEKCCDTYIGRDSRIPVVRLKPKGVNRACPLLTGDRCSVHSLKPTVCALFPLGRVMASDAAPDGMGLGRANEIAYILTPAPCGSNKRKQTVRAWLERFGIPTEDEFFIKWNKTAFELIMAVQKHEGKPYATPKSMDMMWGGIFQALYVDYDTRQEFYPQFETNVVKILRVFAGLEGLY